MKKVMIWLFLLISASTMAVTLDDMIDSVKNEGYSKEYLELEREKLDIEKIGIDKLYNNGVLVEGQLFDYIDAPGDSLAGDISLEYDIFRYINEYDYTEGRTIREMVGIEKNLKDLFYGEKEYQTNLYSLEEIYRINLEKDNVEEEILNLITSYQTYMDTKLELELKEVRLPKLLKDKDMLKKSYEIGTTTEFDYEYSLAIHDNLEGEIEQLKNDLKTQYDSFERLYKIKLDEEIEKVRDVEFSVEEIENVGARSLENIKLQEDITEEKHKYSKYDSTMPDLTAGAYYDIKNDGYLLSLGFSTRFFEYDDTKETLKVEQEILSKNKIQVEQRIKSEKTTLVTEYQTLLNDLENLKRLNKVDEMKYKIYDMKFNQGSESYVDYIEQYNEYLNSSIELEKKQNEIDVFQYKIKNRG